MHSTRHTAPAEVADRATEQAAAECANGTAAGAGGRAGARAGKGRSHKSEAVSRARAVLGLMGLGLLFMTSGQGCVAFRTFDVVTKEQTTIPGSELLGDLLTVSFPGLTTFDLTKTNDFENQGVDKSDIDSVTLDSFTLTVVSPDSQDLAFFDSLSFFVEAEGLDRVRIAHYEDFQAGQREVTLLLDSVEMRDYVASDSMSFTTEVTARQPPDDTVLEAGLSFTVVASQQAACQFIHDILP